jgi:hypothetical protein
MSCKFQIISICRCRDRKLARNLQKKLFFRTRRRRNWRGELKFSGLLYFIWAHLGPQYQPKPWGGPYWLCLPCYTLSSQEETECHQIKDSSFVVNLFSLKSRIVFAHDKYHPVSSRFWCECGPPFFRQTYSHPDKKKTHSEQKVCKFSVEDLNLRLRTLR